MHFSEITTTKFRGCSRHGKSFSVFKSHFLSQTFILFAVAKRKRPATRASVRNASKGAPAKLQGSYCASVKFKGKDRPGVLGGGWSAAGEEDAGGLAEAEPYARRSPRPQATEKRTAIPAGRGERRPKESKEGRTGAEKKKEKSQSLPYGVKTLN